MNARRAEDGTLSYMIYGQMREGGGAQALTGTLNLSVTPILPAAGGAKPVFGQGNSERTPSAMPSPFFARSKTKARKP